MHRKVNGGIYPTMLVAYDEQNKIDYTSMQALIEWYIAEGVHGIFALCHSTEIHCLSLNERLELAKFVIKRVAGRVPVVIAGVTANTMEGQLAEAPLFAALKPDALVLISNRLSTPGKSDMIDNLKRIMKVLPEDLPLGIYECTQPYKRIVSDEDLAFMAQCGRVAFVKDTCCDVQQMKRRVKIVEGSPLKLFNANCATLLETLRFGYHGFSGIMANFHPALYCWMYMHYQDSRSDVLSHYLSVTSLIEMRCYPIPAKRYLQKYVGLTITDHCRSVEDTTVPALATELEGLYELTRMAHKYIGVPMRRYGDPLFISYDNNESKFFVIDKESTIYLGQPTACTLKDGKTVFSVYPKSHAFGQLVLKKSIDGGHTWSDRLNVPDSFSTSLECPTIYRMEDAAGKSRLFIFTGRYPFRVAISEDNGESFSDFKTLGDFGGYFISTVIPLGSGKYMALFHDEGQFINGGNEFKMIVYRTGAGTDKRTSLYTYRSNDGGRSYEKVPFAYPHNPRVVCPGEHWEKIYEAYQSNVFPDRHYELYSIITTDGGLTWSAPQMICSHPCAQLCEPWAIKSHDGKEIAVFLRDNSRKYNSFVIRSHDDGQTWSEPTQVCNGLTGDRHVAVYLPDGRLFVTFRDMHEDSVLKGSWVAWVGTYQDAVSGNNGDCKILIKRNFGPCGDCGYPAVEKLADGTLLLISYGRWTEKDNPYILACRLSPDDIERISHPEQ